MCGSLAHEPRDERTLALDSLSLLALTRLLLARDWQRLGRALENAGAGALAATPASY
jgi:hypothetical protein